MLADRKGGSDAVTKKAAQIGERRLNRGRMELTTNFSLHRRQPVKE
jgi:hypothetical protein